ncbi:MAG: DUF4843 domain-containing protein [Butyricimonas faecihominis]
MVGLVACQENDKTDFDSNGAVYFQVNQGSWSDTRDSIVYSFARKDGDSQTLNVQVNLMGEAVNYERHVRVVVNSGKTTAQEGILCGVGGRVYSSGGGTSMNMSSCIIKILVWRRGFSVSSGLGRMTWNWGLQPRNGTR